MPRYNFQKAIAKPGAFQAAIGGNIPTFNSFSYTNNDVTIYTDRNLTETEQQQMAVLVNNYNDPAVFLVYDHTDTALCLSEMVNSSTSSTVQTFIFQRASVVAPQTLDQMKTVAEYATKDITIFQPGDTASVTITLFDISRTMVIAATTVALTDIIAAWVNSAKAGQTGGTTSYKSAQLASLSSKIPTYDCIWQLKVSVSDPRVSVRLISLQYFWYIKA